MESVIDLKVTFQCVHPYVDIPGLVAGADQTHFTLKVLCKYTMSNIFFISTLLYWHSEDWTVKDV